MFKYILMVIITLVTIQGSDSEFERTVAEAMRGITSYELVNTNDVIKTRRDDNTTYITNTEHALSDKEARIIELQNSEKYANYVVLDIYYHNGNEYALITNKALEEGSIGNSGLPLSDPMTRAEGRAFRRSHGFTPTRPERINNPGSISCSHYRDPDALSVDKSMSQIDPGDKKQCVYKDVQVGFTAMSKLIVRKYSNKPIKKTFKKWQSSRKLFKKKLKACKRKGVNVNLSFNRLSIKQKMNVVTTWAKYEGYRDSSAKEYVVVPDLVEG